MEKKITIILAEDDIDDQDFIKKAYKNMKRKDDIALVIVSDGEELLDYLYKRESFKNKKNVRPDMILMDLNMPKKHGLEVVVEIREDENLKSIPIIILSSSDSAEDIENSYLKGVNSYITKPNMYSKYKDIMTRIEDFWIDIAKLPKGGF